MSPRHTWFWVILAALLGGYIVLFLRNTKETVSAPERILPELKASAMEAIQVRPGGPIPLGIRAERNKGGWQLTQPLVYPAQSANVDKLVEALESLMPATFISPAELRGRPNAEEHYGFASPQASIVIQQGNHRATVLVGGMTTPGDQVFVQVVGRPGIYVTDVAWLRYLPKSVNDWRDRSLVGNVDTYDRLAVTNNTRAFVLLREHGGLWRMVWPLNSARADNLKISDALNKLERLQVRQFVSDDPRTDFESLGLAPAALEVSMGSGTNVVTVLQIGKSVPTATNQVYARRLGQPSIFTVDTEPLAPWRSASVNDFRDPHLLTPTGPIVALDVRGHDSFSVQKHTNNTWHVLPENYTADPVLVQELLSLLTGMKIVQFTKDVVNPPDLPQFGLAAPARRYVVKGMQTNASDRVTNCVLAELNFGTTTNQPEKVFVWRPDESSVYAIATNDFANLPSTSWQLRERKLWDFPVDEVVGLSIRQQGKTRELVRNASHRWSFAPGSQGIINDLAVEETVRGLVQTSAVVWVARGEQARQGYGLADSPFRVTINLKDGGKATVEFGNEAPSTNHYAGIQLDGQYWIFEFSWILYRDVSSYLSIP